MIFFRKCLHILKFHVCVVRCCLCQLLFIKRIYDDGDDNDELYHCGDFMTLSCLVVSACLDDVITRCGHVTRSRSDVSTDMLALTPAAAAQ